jgi:glycosyltransferase involved in cell wall biosynthesis
MKILVVGYACNPYGGSEPGVGWAAVCRIARRHEVRVITDIHNKSGWDKAAEAGLIPSNVRVRFLRKNSSCSANRFIAHIQSWISYRTFNCKVLDAARAWHEEENFDLCHQVTIAAWRMPSPLWQLPIPLVWGPIGGAGYISRSFRGMLSFSARAFEAMRDINTAFASRSRAFRECIAHTGIVFAANEETEEFLRSFRAGRPLVRLPIASFNPERVAQLRRPPGQSRAAGPLRLFAGGNMEGRKGVSLALRALARAAAQGLDFHYTVAGGGPEIPALKTLCHQLGLDDHVEFHPGYSGDAYLEALHRSDVYFLPSFRESTPVTLLEACLAGCYPVVADTSAQGEIVRLVGGTAVPVDDVDSLVVGLADALFWCRTNLAALRSVAAKTATTVQQHFSGESYERTVEDAYALAIGR